MPVARLVRLHDQRTGELVREGWSSDAGVIVFVGLLMGVLYYAVSFDDTGEFSGVVETDILAELMAGA